MKALYQAWTQGYLSAMNTVLVSKSLKPLRHVEPEQITAYLQKYCRDNPLDMVHMGAQHLANELIQQ